MDRADIDKVGGNWVTNVGVKYVWHVADMTGEIGRTVKYPVIVLAILLLARLPLFDNWEWSLLLEAVVVLMLPALWLVTWNLRRRARKRRSGILGNLRKQIANLDPPQPIDDSRRQPVRETINAVERVDHGAFRSFFRDELNYFPLGALTGTIGIALAWEISGPL